MPIIDIPEVGQVEFPEGMTDDEISAAADQLYGEAAQGRVSPNPVVNQKIDASIRLDRNAGLPEQQRQAAATGDTAETAANALSWADFLIRPYAATAENPLGGIGSAARGAGKVLNEAGNVVGAVVRDVRLGNTMLPNTAAALSGTDIGSSPGGPIGAGLDAAGQALPMVAGGMALQAAGVPAPLAFGGPMAASAFEASGGDINTALKAGATGAVIPGVAQAGREAAVTALGKAVAAVVRTGGNVPEKIAEALAAQGVVQVFMEGLNLPEYVQMTPEQRRETLLQNLVANTAFLAMDVPGVVSRTASGTSQTKGGKVVQVGAIMEHLVNDPRAMDRLRVAVDDMASQALNPRRAGMEYTPPEIANVEPQFVDPALEPFRGQELKVEPQVLSAPETIQETLPKEVTDDGQRQIQEEGRQTLLEQRPAPTIEAPTAPVVEAPATAPEPVQQKPANGTKEVPQVAQPLKMQDDAVLVYDRNGVPTGVQGKRYILPGFEDVEFVMTRPSGAKAKGTKRGWTLWEKSSGLRIAESTDIKGKPTSEQEAVQMAMQKLQAIGRSGLEARASAQRQAIEQMRLAKAKAKTVEVPAAAVEKVQEHVAEVAAGEKQATPEPALEHTTGPRAAKEIKSELVQRIEAELAKMPEFPEPSYSKPATYNGKKEFTAGIEGHAVKVREGFGNVWEIVTTVSKPDKKSPTGEKRTEVVLAKTGAYADMTAAKRLATQELEKMAFPKRAKQTIRIQIPGDGDFTINGTRTALERMLARAKALETSSTKAKNYTESLPSRQQGEMWAAESAESPEQSFYVRAGKEFKKVGGKVVKLDAVPEHEFFLHRSIEPGTSGYVVSETTTGLRVGYGANAKEAMKAAEAAVAKMGVERTRQAIAEELKQGNATPRAQAKRSSSMGDPVMSAPVPPNAPAPADSIDTGALGKAGMGGAKPGEFGGFESATSIKNATVDAERAKRGLPPAMEPARRSFGTVWDEAMARIDLDPQLQDRLLDELAANPRAVTDLEDALLLHKQVELQNEYGRATRELAQAYDDAKLFPNRLEMVEMWKARAQTASDQLLALYNINKSVGTETARGLNARKMLAREDYTLEAMEVSKRLANEGAPLDDAQRAELEAAHAKIAELQRAHDDYVQRAEEERARRRAEETVREMAAEAAKAPTYDPRIIKIAEEIVQKLEKRAETARASVREKLARLNAGVDPTLIYELGVIGAAKIARKGLDLTRFTADMVGEFGEKIRPFINDVWTSANTFLENEGAKYGDKAEPIRRILRKRDEQGRRENIVAGLKKAHAEGQPVDLLGDYVRKLAESFVRGGITTREPLIDAVHGVLTAEVDPAITRRETMDAISGYGRFKPLNPDAIKAQLRTLKGEMQQLAKLEDIQNRQPLKKTGVERRLVGDEERRLIAQVNEAKRRFGVVVTDPARQLKSALDAVTTRLKNSIADLEYQIATGARTVKTKTPAPTSPEVELLKARRDVLRAELDTLIPRPEMTDAQRIQIAAKHVERGIAELERRIASRDVAPAEVKRTPLNSPHLDALRAKREALKAEFDALRDALDPARAERVALATLKARMQAQTARYLERLARGDFAPRARKEVPMDEEALRLKAKLQMAKEAWQRGLELDRMKHRTLLHKAGHAVREALNIPRSMLSSWDFSAVLRQGGFIAMGHPVRAVKALPDMFRAWANPERAAMVDQEILSRPNAPRYIQAKLYLAPLETTHLSTMEEAFMSRLAKSIPGVARSNRAFVTFLNRLRADSFDALVNRMELGGPKLDNAELQAVANYINVATGRGDMGRAAAAAETLATVFFSPRLVTSRFQLLAGQPAWTGTARTRRAVAAEYGRFLAGLAVVYGLANLAGAAMEEDPRSSDFGKLKFGNTRVDPLGGLSQVTVLLSRLATGETKTAQGDVKDIRGKVPFGESTSADVVWRFLRSKLAPVPAVALDVASGSNVVGEPVTATDAALRLVVPLSFSDIYDVMKEQGVPAGTALGMLSVFGYGLQQQPDPDVRLVVGELMKQIRTGSPDEREAIRQAYEQQFSTNKAGLKEWADALRFKKQTREEAVK